MMNIVIANLILIVFSVVGYILDTRRIMVTPAYWAAYGLAFGIVVGTIIK